MDLFSQDLLHVSMSSRGWFFEILYSLRLALPRDPFN